MELLWATLTIMCMVALSISEAANGGWNDAPNTQYHIQTDEGPERYFRYQTISGQYRKEKRLEDGTVVGTNGWVDPNGYLRLQDYIADNAGYRILKSKMVFVGKDQPVQNAVAISKSVPASSGVLVGPTPQVYTTPAPPPSATPAFVRVTPNSIETSTKSPIPRVEISHNGIQSTTPRPYSTTPANLITSTPPVFLSSTYLPSPSSSYVPPIDSTEAYVSSTPSYDPPSSSYQPPFLYNRPTPAPIIPFSSNALSYTPRNNYYRPRYEQPNPYRGSYRPSFEHPNPAASDRNAHYNQIGNGYTPQFPEYDGVSITRNGFRYSLPRHYHEEENLPGDQRTGSFGYIDPFGIRRVIYYNTAPGTGFVHKKNNRYVGFNATPYDPRPY